MGFSGDVRGKEPACQFRRCKRQEFSPWVGKIPWSREWQLTPVFLPGEFQGWRSLVGCDPWGHKEPDVTEWLTHTELFNSVMLVSGVQQRASGGHIHVSILFQILFPFKLL